MEPVEVTARFDLQGVITPLRFTFQGREFPVEAAGRRWLEDDGSHYLVMAGGGRLFELVFVAPEGCWYMGRMQPNQAAA